MQDPSRHRLPGAVDMLQGRFGWRRLQKMCAILYTIVCNSLHYTLYIILDVIIGVDHSRIKLEYI